MKSVKNTPAKLYVAISIALVFMIVIFNHPRMRPEEHFLALHFVQKLPSVVQSVQCKARDVKSRLCNVEFTIDSVPSQMVTIPREIDDFPDNMFMLNHSVTGAPTMDLKVSGVEHDVFLRTNLDYAVVPSTKALKWIDTLQSKAVLVAYAQARAEMDREASTTSAAATYR